MSSDNYKYKLAVIGGIGSGKSTLINSLTKSFPNSEYVNYDSVAKEILNKLESSEIQNLNNSEVFENPQKLAELENKLHPLVYKQALEVNSNSDLEIHEIPVLAESERSWPANLYSFFDYCLVLQVNKQERLNRLKNSRFGSFDVEKRINLQVTDSKRVAAAKKVSKIVVGLWNR